MKRLGWHLFQLPQAPSSGSSCLSPTGTHSERMHQSPSPHGVPSAQGMCCVLHTTIRQVSTHVTGQCGGGDHTVPAAMLLPLRRGAPEALAGRHVGADGGALHQDTAGITVRPPLAQFYQLEKDRTSVKQDNLINAQHKQCTSM
jgi:hypothetical protein